MNCVSASIVDHDLWSFNVVESTGIQWELSENSTGIQRKHNKNNPIISGDKSSGRWTLNVPGGARCGLRSQARCFPCCFACCFPHCFPRCFVRYFAGYSALIFPIAKQWTVSNTSARLASRPADNARTRRSVNRHRGDFQVTMEPSRPCYPLKRAIKRCKDRH